VKEIIPLPPEVNDLSRKVVHAAFLVHSHLGPGLLESVYGVCFAHELQKVGIVFRREMTVPVLYDGLELDAALRIDFFVNDQVVVELKAAEILLPVHDAQLLTYMKLLNVRLGLLINFNVPYIKDGIRRLVL
jgi:GxxExxY protein